MAGEDLDAVVDVEHVDVAGRVEVERDDAAELTALRAGRAPGLDESARRVVDLDLPAVAVAHEALAGAVDSYRRGGVGHVGARCGRRVSGGEAGQGEDEVEAPGSHPL